MYFCHLERSRIDRAAIDLAKSRDLFCLLKTAGSSTAFHHFGCNDGTPLGMTKVLRLLWFKAPEEIETHG